MMAKCGTTPKLGFLRNRQIFRFNKQTGIIGQPNKFDALHDKILYIAKG
jgi:hypothetical protein